MYIINSKLESLHKLKENQIIDANLKVKTLNEHLEEAKKELNLKTKELKIIKQLQDHKINVKTEELRKANKSLSTFLYRSSHDIMGPTATLKGIVNIAKIDIKDEVSLDYFSKIENILIQLERIIQSVNAEFEINNKELDLSSFSLYDATEDHLKKYDTEIARGFNIIIDIPREIVLTTDRYLFDLILREVINNAIQYQMKEKTSDIDLKISGYQISKEYVHIKFSDNGIGIADDRQKGVFDMFKRATEKSKGSGLGLYLVKGALKRLNGKVKLGVESGFKTCFEIKIPNRS
ncbi:MAG: HAMP domain-containing histidine kinase [Cyclobacteriaceae bacterium]|nr:HAMP domain-containing histidine kinase [Cyclobacteriaceae bacterium]